MSWNTYCATPKQPKANVVRPNQHPTPDLPPPPSHKWTDPFRWGKSLIADCNAATSVSAMTPRHTTEIFAICSNPRNMLKKLNSNHTPISTQPRSPIQAVVQQCQPRRLCTLQHPQVGHRGYRHRTLRAWQGQTGRHTGLTESQAQTGIRQRRHGHY
mmetsp:Transcript_89676/g.178303  ORF Transcript_89676/g.178303 Transcript_89676/m.178303 type:complete len:157 (-) Transcript_89676:294-764(-)